MYSRSKYGNRKSGGYDSKKERHRAFELKMLERQGIISDLKEQVKFELIPAQYETYLVPLKTKMAERKRCVEHACSYIADFTYYDEEGAYVVEDAKGFKTEIYRLKKKLMLQKYGIKIKEA